MRQLVLTALKKLKNIEVFVNLFEEWLGEKCKISRITKHYISGFIGVTPEFLSKMKSNGLRKS